MNQAFIRWWRGIRTTVFFAEIDQPRVSRLLTTVVLVGSLAAGFYLVGSLFMAPVELVRLPILAGILVIFSIVFLLNWRGHVRAAVLTLNLGLWGTFQIVSALSGGLQAAASAALLVNVVIAGLLLGSHYGLFFAIVSMIANAIMLLLDVRGLLPAGVLSQSAASLWLENAIYLGITAVLLHLFNRSLAEALAQSRQRSAALARQNVELERLSRSLEQQTQAVQQATQQRRQVESQFRYLFENARDVVVLLDPAGEIVDVNPATEQLLGYTREELVGRHFLPFVHPDDLQRSQELFAQLQQSETASPLIEFRILAKQETYRTLEFRSSPQFVDGKLAGIWSIARDITERRHAEELLRQAQKLDSLGLLAGGVAHDFNNLLVAILGQTSLAESHLPAEHPAYLAIQKATRAARRAADLTRQLLAYSGRGQFLVNSLSLNQLVEENLSFLTVGIAKQIHVRTELAAGLPLIEADAGQIQQVLMNLLLNAAQAIGEEGGTINVVTGLQRIRQKDRVYWQQTGRPLAPGVYVTLEVHDTGAGMASETVEKIFDPFFTTKAAGRGLGLAAVLGIVRGHGGGLHVYSEVGRGTTFKLLFPAAAAESELEPDVPLPQTAVFEGVVLLIDDEAPVREAVRDILQSVGIRVLAADSGQTGIDLLLQHQDTVRLVLLDLSMPDLSGEETFRALRQLDSSLPVLLSSGYNELEATHRFTGKGLTGFLQKPYDSETLLARVREYL